MMYHGENVLRNPIMYVHVLFCCTIYIHCVRVVWLDYGFKFFMDFYLYLTVLVVAARYDEG